jgi:3-oxoacyl-[acyl-carrier-protein] synthase II
VTGHSDPAARIDERIAVTGCGVSCAAGFGLDRLRASLAARTDHVGPLPDAVADLLAMRRGALFPDTVVDGRARALDGATRSFTATSPAVGEALAHAGLLGTRGGALYCGTALAGVEWFEERAAAGLAARATTGRGHSAHDLSLELAEVHGLDRAPFTVSATCASALYAIERGCLDLALGRVPFAVCGGVDTLTRFMQTGFHALGALHDEAENDGLILGEAACFVVLEPLGRALARGARVLGVLAGRAIRADAYHLTAPDESGRGMVEAIHACLADAGRDVADVGHLTFTAHGSRRYAAMYENVLMQVFGPVAERLVRVSSWEEGLGHVLAATGAFGVLHAALLFEDPSVRGDVLALTVGFGGQNGATLVTRPEAFT